MAKRESRYERMERENREHERQQAELREERERLVDNQRFMDDLFTDRPDHDVDYDYEDMGRTEDGTDADEAL